MTYHSLAIYYDNQLAENEQKRVPRDNRFANLRNSIEREKWRTTMVLPMRHSWRRAARPPSNFSLSMLSRTMPPVGLLGVAFGHITHALSYHAALGLLGVASGHITHALSYHAALGSHYPPVGLLSVSPFRAHHACGHCGHARLRAGHRARLRASLRAAPCA